MSKNSSRIPGRHFLHIPGPTPLPDRVLRAMDTPIIDHRGPEFSKLAKRCLDLAAHLIARDEAPASIDRGGRKAQALEMERVERAETPA